ncbi:54S ribosomal protein L16, mitochondrial [[Candida] railenensis]|uniref:54S ribosomal protein L16, mitochondrial n=1 Tax=[Candida] railenensis TaxID=45579 RepID=A0A9P0W0B7_9ASCO|nr:54S ribosomal protein L16, mitochondrial [[Candida] railenensis]
MLSLGAFIKAPAFSIFKSPSAVPFLGGASGIIAKRFTHEYAPRYKRIRKQMKGDTSVRTGGSIKGNALEYGIYGLRLKSRGIRMTATQLQEADKVIKREIRPTNGKLFTRFICNVAVCIKGNQTRMGKGKGAFSHWAARVPTGKVLFEIDGTFHEKVAKEALRKAAAKLPGIFEIIDKDSKVRVSITDCIDKPEPINYVDMLNKNPTKKWANLQTAKDPMYMLYRGR